MKSLFARLLLWFGGAIVVIFAGFVLITAVNINGSPPHERMLKFQLNEARYAWETRGTEGLAAFAERHRRTLHGALVLTDASAIDLLTGRDQSDLLAASRHRLPFFDWSGAVITMRSDDGKYRLFVKLPPSRFAGWFFVPHNLWVLLSGILLCYSLAWYVTTPLRAMRQSVERFGQGDFTARIQSKRSDELGQLAQAFDRMAERIQLLISAERRLLQDISHELRSPLTRLGVSVALLDSEEDRPAAVLQIRREAERLNKLITELLQVTRAEGDPQALHAMPLRLDELMEEVVDDCLIEARAKDCRIGLNALDEVWINGDGELLRRAVENVLRNAIRHTAEGTAVELELRTEGRRAALEIRDHGPGVPEDALSRIFDPFFRVETDRNRAKGGVGLGLSIARRALAIHQGTVTARNAIRGLIVRIELPVLEMSGTPARGITPVPARADAGD